MATNANPLGQHNAPPEGFRLLEEGSAAILYEANEKLGDKGEPVFYNKVQVLNRDLSIRVMTAFARRRALELAMPRGNRAKRRAQAAALAAAKVKRHAGGDSGSGEVSVEVDGATSSGGGGGGGGGGSGSSDAAMVDEAGVSSSVPSSSPSSSSSSSSSSPQLSAGQLAAAAAMERATALAELSPREFDQRLRDDTAAWLERGSAGGGKKDGAAAEAAESEKPPPPDDYCLGHGGIRVLDALAATGLRSIRYYKEVPGVRQVVVNDLDPEAVEAAERNVRFNGLTTAQVTPRRGDANLAMLQGFAAAEGEGEDGDGGGGRGGGGGKFDVIDLDPYGSAAPFLDAAVQSVADGGLLCVTCTDMAVLSGNQPEACYAKYGCMPTKGRYLHEMALRILLHSLEACANRYKRHIVPVISCGIDFYVRVFVRVFESPAEVKKSCLKAGYVLQSHRCPSFHLQPVAKLVKQHSYGGATAPTSGGQCAETGGGFKLGGPMWTAPLHDMDWVREMLDDVTRHREQASELAVQQGRKPKKGGYEGFKASVGGTLKAKAPFDNGLADAKQTPLFPPIQTKDRLHGLLTAVSEELPDVPLYYTLPSLCETVHCSSPKMDDFRSALVNAGYRVSAFHKEADAIKTDAPNNVVWDIIRCWVAKRPLHSKRAEAAQSPGTLILAKAPQLQADFSRPRGGKRGGFVGKAHRPKAQRFPQNPEADWGPKARARHAPPAAAPTTAAPTAAAAPEVAPGHENAEEANACDAEPASKKAKF